MRCLHQSCHLHHPLLLLASFLLKQEFEHKWVHCLTPPGVHHTVTFLLVYRRHNFFFWLFFVGTSQRGHRSPPPPMHHNSNDTQHPTRSLTATIDSLDCFLSSVYLTSRSRKGTPLPYRTRHCWSALDFKLQCCFSYLGEVPSFLCLRNKWLRYQHLTRSGSFCL